MTISGSIRAEFDCVEESTWYDLLWQFNDSSIYQTWAYGKVRWGDENVQRCVVKDEGEVIAIAQIYIRRLKYIDMGIAYIPWGPLWRKRESPFNLDNLKCILRALVQKYSMSNRFILRIRPNELHCQNSRIVEEQILKMGFKKSRNSNLYRTLLLDITPPLEKLRENLNQKWRNQLKKAEKSGIEVIEGTDDEMYTSFLSLQREMQERKKYTPGVDYAAFQKIQEELPQGSKMMIMLGRYEGSAICASIASALGNTGIYLLGATATSGLKCNGSNLLQWKMIQYLKESQMSFYDLGGINPRTNPGVYNFKKRLAGKRGKDIAHIGSFDYANNAVKYFLFYLLERIVKG